VCSLVSGGRTWQVTLCDPIWQVTPRICEMDWWSSINNNSYTLPLPFYVLFVRANYGKALRVCRTRSQNRSTYFISSSPRRTDPG